MFIYHVLPHTPPLVFGDARNRRNEITLERVGIMSHIFADTNPPTCDMCVVLRILFVL